MTQTNDTCRGGRPSGARRPGAGRIATRRTRMRVSSDAVSPPTSATSHGHTAGGEQHDSHPVIIPPPSSIATIPRSGGDGGFSRIPCRA